jgi:hypothetical protein
VVSPFDFSKKYNFFSQKVNTRILVLDASLEPVLSSRQKPQKKFKKVSVFEFGTVTKSSKIGQNLFFKKASRFI